jgi:enoyl-[acyl-carrier-protein] reductase (NADH)
MMKPMKGKVALLIQDTRSSGWSLAVSLARLGADVALVCQDANAEQARDTEKRIEAEGQQCLIVPVHALNRVSSQEVVRQTIAMFGGLDLFIDYSSPAESFNESKKGLQQASVVTENNPQSPLTHLEMLAAALYQMADIGDTFEQSKQNITFDKDTTTN